MSLISDSLQKRKNSGKMKDFRELKARDDFRFKKALGQNLLVDPNIINRIIKSCSEDDKNIGKDCHVLEIGPGTGAITELLCTTFKKVTACELDSVMVEMVTKKCGRFDNFSVINEDILKLDLEKLDFQKIVANLPYSISTRVISKIIDRIAAQELKGISSMYALVQEEVADRICCTVPGKTRSPLGLKTNAVAVTKKLFRVAGTCFRPRPKVSSAFIRISFNTEEPGFTPDEYALAMEIINFLYTMRRKKIFKVFSRFISKKGEIKIEDNERNHDAASSAIIKNAGLDQNLRPEKIEWDQFIKLARAYRDYADMGIQRQTK
jgi:16S rRNA (adenine1518-N6/adenine1519-N6)-dimethyltransferase